MSSNIPTFLWIQNNEKKPLSQPYYCSWKITIPVLGTPALNATDIFAVISVEFTSYKLEADFSSYKLEADFSSYKLEADLSTLEN